MKTQSCFGLRLHYAAITLGFLAVLGLSGCIEMGESGEHTGHTGPVDDTTTFAPQGSLALGTAATGSVNARNFHTYTLQLNGGMSYLFAETSGSNRAHLVLYKTFALTTLNAQEGAAYIGNTKSLTAASPFADQSFYFRPVTAGTYTLVVTAMGDDLDSNYSVLVSDESASPYINEAAIVNALSVDKTTLVNGNESATATVNTKSLGTIRPDLGSATKANRYNVETPLTFSSHTDTTIAVDDTNTNVVMYPRGDAAAKASYPVAFVGRTRDAKTVYVRPNENSGAFVVETNSVTKSAGVYTRFYQETAINNLSIGLTGTPATLACVPPKLTTTPTLSATSVAIGGSFTVTLPVNTNVDAQVKFYSTNSYFNAGDSTYDEFFVFKTPAKTATASGVTGDVSVIVDSTGATAGELFLGYIELAKTGTTSCKTTYYGTRDGSFVAQESDSATTPTKHFYAGNSGYTVKKISIQ